MTALDTLNFVAFNPVKNNSAIAIRRRHRLRRHINGRAAGAA
jgi:hypothetical protein